MYARRVIDLLVARDQLTLQAGLRTMTVFHCSLLANIQVCFLIACCCCAMTLSSDLFHHRMSSRDAFSTTNRSCLKFWRRLTPRLTWASLLPPTHNASMVRGRVGPTLVACSHAPVCVCVRVCVGVGGCLRCSGSQQAASSTPSTRQDTRRCIHPRGRGGQWIQRTRQRC